MKLTLKKLKGHTLKYGIYYFLIVAIPILCLTMNVDKVKGMQAEFGADNGASGSASVENTIPRIGGSIGLPGTGGSIGLPGIGGISGLLQQLIGRTDGYGTLTKEPYLVKDQAISFIPGHRSISRMYINNKLAMCIQSGVGLTSNTSYKRGEKYTNKLVIKAYEYISQAPSKKWRVVAGQMFAWYVIDNGITSLPKKHSEAEKDRVGKRVLDALEEAFRISNGGVSSSDRFEAGLAYELIMGQSGTSLLYQWDPICGTSQSFVSSWWGCKGDECPKEIECGNDTPGTPVKPGPGACELPENLPHANIAGDCEVTSTYNDPKFDTGCVVGNNKYLDTATLTGLAPNYCTLFCREDIKTGYPGSGYTFYAGRFFTVGTSPAGNSWGPVVIEGTRTCVMTTDKTGKTNGINTAQFIRDYDAANENMRNSYNDWQRELKRAEAARKAIADGERCEYDCSDYKTTSAKCSEGSKSGGSCYIRDEDGNKVNVGPPTECPADYSLSGSKCEKYIEKTCSSREYLSVYDWYWEGGASGSEGGQSCNTGRPSGYNSSYESSYRKYKAEVQALEAALRQCAGMQIKYDFTPKISMGFSEGFYSYNNPLISAGSYNYVNVNNEGEKAPAGNFSECSGSDCNLKYYSCKGEVCYRKTQIVEKVVQNANSQNKTAINFSASSFKLGNTGYRYAKKTNGTVIGNLTNDEKDNGSYYDLKDWVIPLSFNLVPGSSFAPQLHYFGIGNRANKENQPHFDYLSSIHTEKKKTIIITGADNKIDDGSDYKCSFNLINDIECKGCANGTTPVGLDVIYRPIKLGSASVAFPGIKGNGRKPGANWSSTDINKVITNNRGVKGDEVYNLDPIYTITLTPGVIKQIRQYNAAVNNYANFDMVCKEGKNCLSNFLHSTVKTGSGSFSFSGLIGGSCSSTSVNNFEACRGSGR